jgi:hypothetical protein
MTKLMAFCCDPSHSADWDTFVAQLCYAYNTTVHRSHGYTPFFLLHGYNPSFAYSLYVPALDSPLPARGDAHDAAAFRKRHARFLKIAHSRLEDDALRSKRHLCQRNVGFRSSQYEIKFVLRLPTCRKIRLIPSFHLGS